MGYLLYARGSGRGGECEGGGVAVQPDAISIYKRDAKNKNIKTISKSN